MAGIYRSLFVLSEPDGDQQVLGGEVVFESEDHPVRAGLLDAQGTPLYRFPRREPMGFRVIAKGE